MKFGKRGLKTDYRTLKFAAYAAALAPPPAAVDNFKRATASAQASFEQLFPMDGNDTIGDCTIAGLAHTVTLYRAMIGQGLIPADQGVRDLYFALTGGQDTGLFCLDVVKYVQQNGVLDTSKILAYVSIDPKNHIHVKQAISIFGCAYLGFQVQGGAIPDFVARKPWDYSYNMTQDGHCVAAGAYDDTTGLLTVVTWGRDQQATWAWWDQTVDECYVILPSEAKDPAFAPGLDVAQLSVDLISVKS